jgi:hypothetical protein
VIDKTRHSLFNEEAFAEELENQVGASNIIAAPMIRMYRTAAVGSIDGNKCATSVEQRCA